MIFFQDFIKVDVTCTDENPKARLKLKMKRMKSNNNKTSWKLKEIELFQ